MVLSGRAKSAFLFHQRLSVSKLDETAEGTEESFNCQPAWAVTALSLNKTTRTFPSRLKVGGGGWKGKAIPAVIAFPCGFISSTSYPSSSQRHLRGGLSHHHTPPSHTVQYSTCQCCHHAPGRKQNPFNDSLAITDPNKHGNRTRHQSDDPSLTFPSISKTWVVFWTLCTHVILRHARLQRVTVW